MDVSRRWYPSVLHERWVVKGHVSHVGVRLRICAILSPSVFECFTVTNISWSFFFFGKLIGVRFNVVKIQEVLCSTYYVSRRRVRRLRHNVPEPSTYMSHTFDSSMLKVRSQRTWIQVYDDFCWSLNGPFLAYVYACLKNIHSTSLEGLGMHEEHMITGNNVLKGFRSFELRDTRAGKVWIRVWSRPMS